VKVVKCEASTFCGSCKVRVEERFDEMGELELKNKIPSVLLLGWQSLEIYEPLVRLSQTFSYVCFSLLNLVSLCSKMWYKADVYVRESRYQI